MTNLVQPYSQSQHLDLDRMADATHRGRKAEKIRAVLAAQGLSIGEQTRVLDIGCGQGLILRHLLATGGIGVGVDPDPIALGRSEPRIFFTRAEGERVPVADGCIDLVICNHVYEHAADAVQLVREIQRVLKPRGICYFAGPNKFSPVEPHFNLPLLSWLPQPLADRYVRWTKRGARYDCRPLSWWALDELLAEFEYIDYTGEVIDAPRQFWVDDLLPPGSIKHRLAQWVWRIFPWVVPDFVLLLRKRRRA